MSWRSDQKDRQTTDRRNLGRPPIFQVFAEKDAGLWGYSSAQSATGGKTRLSYQRSIMSYKSLTEIMDSLPPDRRAKVEARAKELKEEYPIAAEVIRELVEEREQLKARIAELEEDLKYHKQQRKP